MFLHRQKKIHAIEFPKNLDWINGKSQSLKDLKGKIVLLDFWTYSCINCLRTLPFLQKMHKLYADKGLVIIGIHTPEFDFEQQEAFVQRAVRQYGIPYPVVLDNDYKIWSAYANRWWPRKLLIDHHGEIVYDHIGEGAYAHIEAEIQKALFDIGLQDLPEIVPDKSIGGGVCYRTTPECYLGFLRGKFGNVARFIPGQEHVFTDPKHYTDDLVYLHGHWRVEKEHISHTRALPSIREFLAIKYSAFSVNLVGGSQNKRRAAEVVVELDGQMLPEDMAGDDIEYKKGKAILRMTMPRMYRVIDSDVYHKGVLKLKTASDHLDLYALTFGGCKGM